MKENEQMRIVAISYVVSILGSFVLNYLIVNSPFLNGVISSIKVSTLLTLWWAFYFKLGWKIIILKKILYRINLNGTWFGSYDSMNMETKQLARGKIGLRICQDFLNISIKSYTDNYQNYSYSEEIKYEKKSKSHGLVYVYSQKENNSLDLNQRNGTAELQVKRCKEILLLEGEFWTVHGTKGKLIVRKVSDQIVDTFLEANELAGEQINGFDGGIA
ncbi:MAG: hypothetical protein PHZ03_04090 [Syntrophomonas sp.]|nr:hypothetical protein [Syntrophomonas sp.]